MLKCFVTTYRVRLSMMLNRWIYYLQKIPLVKRIFPDSLYGKVGIKDSFSMIMIMGSILIEICKKAFYVGLLFLVIHTLVDTEDLRLASFIQLFIFTSVGCGALNNFTMFLTDETRRMFLKILRFDAPLYIRTQMYSEYLIYLLFMTPCMIIAMYFLGGNVLQAIGLISLAITTHLLTDLCQMKIFAKYRKLPMIKHSTWIVSLSLIVLIIGLFLNYNEVVFDMRYSAPYFMISIVFTIPILRYIQHYPLYTEASQVSIVLYDQLMSSVSGQYIGFQDVAIRDKDAIDMKINKNTYANRKGYDYLNALFFHRQKRIFFRPVRNRLIIISIISILTIIVCDVMDIGKDVQLQSLLPFLVLIMYFLSVGNRACRSLFYNCDVSLLEYSFYRRKDHVLRNFVIRLRYLIGYNLIAAVVLCIYVIFGTLSLGIPSTILDIIIFIIAIILLSILFSLHHLFLYYVFQPYTRDFNEKNPIASLLNSAMYFICYLVSSLDFEIDYFIYYVIFFTVSYIIIALCCVYRYAPKTFRIR